MGCQKLANDFAAGCMGRTLEIKWFRQQSPGNRAELSSWKPSRSMHSVNICKQSKHSKSFFLCNVEKLPWCGLHGATLRFVLTFPPSCLWKFWWSLDWSCWVSRTTNIILCRGWLQIPSVSDTFQFLEFPEHLWMWWWTAVDGLYNALIQAARSCWLWNSQSHKIAARTLESGRSRTGNSSLQVSDPEALWFYGTALLWNMAILRLSSRFLKTMLRGYFGCQADLAKSPKHDAHDISPDPWSRVLQDLTKKHQSSAKQ